VGGARRWRGTCRRRSAGARAARRSYLGCISAASRLHLGRCAGSEEELAAATRRVASLEEATAALREELCAEREGRRAAAEAAKAAAEAERRRRARLRLRRLLGRHVDLCRAEGAVRSARAQARRSLRRQVAQQLTAMGSVAAVLAPAGLCK